MKKILSMFLVLCMIVTMLPVTATAEETEKTIPQDNNIMADGLIAPMSATTYDIWVGGVQVTGENMNSVTGSGITGTVSYDPDTLTLTLSGATITSSHAVSAARYGIYAPGGLNLKLVGTNTITFGSGDTAYGICTQYSDLQISTEHNGSLTITTNGNFGIYSDNLTINSDEITTVRAVIWGTESVEISGGTVTSTGGVYGIVAQSSFITISNATVTASGSTAALVSSGGSPDFTGMQVTASIDESGTPSVPYDASNLANYKYIKVEPSAVGTDVAQIGAQGYPTLQAAVDDVSEGQTIMLLDDIYLTGTVTVGIGISKNFTLDLNGKTLRCNSGSVITHQGTGTLTIADSGSGGMVIGYANSPTIYNHGSGTVYISGGTVSSTLTNVSTIYNLSTGIVHVSDGIVRRGAGGMYAIENYGNGTVELSGGTIEQQSGVAISIRAEGSGKIIIASGEPVIKGSTWALNAAPDLGDYYNVRITASKTKTDGTETSVITKEDIDTRAKVEAYKYLKFEPAAPLANTIPNIQIDFVSERLTGFVLGEQYTINGSSSFTIPEGEVYSIPEQLMGESVSIIHKGNGTTTSDSPAQILSVPARPTAPTDSDYTVEHETTAGTNDGKLKVSIPECEYRPLNNYSGFWLDIPQNEWKENLPPDTYYVRKKAVENTSFASENSTAIVINAGAPLPALVSNLSVGDVTLDPLTVGYVTSTYKSFVITNSGDAQATIRNVTTDNPSVFSIHPGQSFVDAGSSINSWQIRTETGLAAGTYSATITVTYDDDRTTTSAVSITINAPVNHDSTGRSSSSSNNSMPVIVTLPTAVNPDSPTQGEIKVPGTVDGNGNVTASITDKTVTDAFDKALTEAKKNSIEQNGITVVLRVDTGNKTGSNITVNLPKTVQDTIIAKKIINTIVVVDNPGIRIGMDLETVKEINKQAKTDVNITAARTHGSKLTADAKKAIGSRPVFDLMVNYGNGNTIRGFGTGSVSITLPYTLAPNERAENVQAVYVDESGNVHWLKNSVYDNTEKVLRFTTNHFSAYGVGYKQSYSAFTDIAGHWAKEDIEFVTEHRIFNGTSDTTFSPDTDMTRGMFITVLGRFANADVSTYTNSSFIDVKDDAYYMSYIEWANKNNIAGGIGDYKFEPDQSVTREQMAFIINNYAKNLGYTLPGVHAENTFADNDEISSYAKEA
ncbi:S-layer homology domain-containing protein, partial [Sedimentibacter sp.]|uniref:S-layer homology domain-containing protein n=1 Tax=Sedimentibacter sp. TaxID=1960295 RepID=UPI0028A29E9A